MWLEMQLVEQLDVSTIVTIKPASCNTARWFVFVFACLFVFVFVVLLGFFVFSILFIVLFPPPPPPFGWIFSYLHLRILFAF